jgi:hypothetical protein
MRDVGRFQVNLRKGGGKVQHVKDLANKIVICMQDFICEVPDSVLIIILILVLILLLNLLTDIFKK